VRQGAAPQADPPKVERDRAFTRFFAVFAAVNVCAALALAWPRPVAPVQLPPLQLDRAAVERVLARDRELAARASHSPRARELRALHAEEGEAELSGAAGVAKSPARRRRLAAYAAQLVAQEGLQSLEALRAEATQEAMAELAVPGRTSPMLGKFPSLLARYGVLGPDGALRVPAFAVRAAYKVRWNLIHERPLTEAFAPIEVQAYQGLLALHAGALQPERRAAAAQAFYQASGVHGGEAYAIWLFQGGAHGPARALMDRVYAESGALRHRNMALYMQLQRP
jgi:hypothetical protein